MSPPPKRRLLDQIGASPTFLAAAAKFSGDIETHGPLVLCGSVHGDGNIDGALSMTAGSEWHGEIHAHAAIIAGRVVGRLEIQGKLEVGASAVLQADIIAGSIAIAKGAVIEGEVHVTSGEPVLRFEEKRQ